MFMGALHKCKSSDILLNVFTFFTKRHIRVEYPLGDPVVSALYGKVERDEKGLVVTLGVFTPAVKNFARNKSNLRLIDGEELVGLVLQHYEQFDSSYKGLLPLKRVYVPEPVDPEDV